MKKKRNKKYNRVEAARKNNEFILKDMAVAYFVNDAVTKQDILLTDLKGNRLHVTLKISDAITNYRYKWKVYLCAGCLSSKGVKELKIEQVVSNNYYLQSELVERLNEIHQEFFNDLRSKNVRIEFGGWVAKASGRELNDDEIDVIFDKLNAWDIT